MPTLRDAINKPPPHTKMGSVAILTLLLAATASVLLYSAIQFSDQLARTRAAASDSRVWSVGQVEVDYTNLRYKLLEFNDRVGRASSDIEELKLAFDIFLSRISIVSIIIDQPDMPQSVKSDLTKVIDVSQKLTRIFDNLDFSDTNALARFQIEIAAMSANVRQITLGALMHYVDQAESSRAEETVLWARMRATTISLLSIMAAAMLLTVRIRRQISKQIRGLQSASDNILMVYEASMISVIVTDCSGNITLFNKSAELLFGWSEACVKGCNIADTVMPEHLRAAHRAASARYRETGRDLILEGGPTKTLGLCADGRQVPIEVSMRANRDMNGHKTVVAFIRDISEQLAQEADLREARDQARHHAEAKSMFLATMSHEMRTPLHGLLASLELIDDQELRMPARNLLHTARECGMRSLQQVNDVLQVTEVSEVEEPVVPMDPTKVIGAIVEELNNLAVERDNQMQIVITGEKAGQKWLAKPKTFTRVMYNLIGNAIKFTHGGTVKIALDFVSGTSNNTMLHVEVVDTGIGIAVDDCARVFEPFFTSSLSDTHNHRNHTGLGLAIAHIGVQKMAGNLSLISEVGVGSRFFFAIPLLAVTEDTISFTDSENTPESTGFGLHCLVTDDNIVNLRLTAQMLRKIGCSVDEAQSGRDAVDLAFATAYDIVFMDMNMPGGLSGYQATDLIRKSGCSKDVVIVALTADTTLHDKAKLESYQMNMVLHKPFNGNDLKNILATVVPKQQTVASMANSSASESEHNMETQPDFEDLFELIGRASAGKLLVAVQNDIDDAIQSVSNPSSETIDKLHRAIGSTAAVGLLKLSQLLRQAENHMHSSPSGGFSDIVAALQDAVEDARFRILLVLNADINH